MRNAPKSEPSPPIITLVVIDSCSLRKIQEKSITNRTERRPIGTTSITLPKCIAYQKNIAANAFKSPPAIAFSTPVFDIFFFLESFWKIKRPERKIIAVVFETAIPSGGESIHTKPYFLNKKVNAKQNAVKMGAK